MFSLEVDYDVSTELLDREFERILFVHVLFSIYFILYHIIFNIYFILYIYCIIFWIFGHPNLKQCCIARAHIPSVGLKRSQLCSLLSFQNSEDGEWTLLRVVQFNFCLNQCGV